MILISHYLLGIFHVLGILDKKIITRASSYGICNCIQQLSTYHLLCDRLYQRCWKYNDRPDSPGVTELSVQ